MVHRTIALREIKFYIAGRRPRKEPLMSVQSQHHVHPDPDPSETQEWLGGLDAGIEAAALTRLIRSVEAA